MGTSMSGQRTVQAIGSIGTVKEAGGVVPRERNQEGPAAAPWVQG